VQAVPAQDRQMLTLRLPDGTEPAKDLEGRVR
jgi:hypothetical protein